MFSLSSLLAVPVMAALVGSAIVSLAMFLHELLRRRQCLPALHYRESALNSRLLARCGLRQRLYSPSFWLASPHLQTVLGACWPHWDPNQQTSFQREYLQMRDKGVVALDWVLGVQPRVKRKSTVLLVLPPVTGTAQTVSPLCTQATKRGFRTVVFNRRGHGDSVLTTAKLLSAADPSDLRQVVKYLRMRFPKSRLAAVSYGTGCGLLISYLGEFGSSALLSAGACVSPCYDTVEKFSGPLRSIYDMVHLLKLKKILLQHASALSSVLDVRQALLSAWNLGAYEEKVYCKMYHYVTRSDSASHPNNPVFNVCNVDDSSANGGGALNSTTNAIGTTTITTTTTTSISTCNTPSGATVNHSSNGNIGGSGGSAMNRNSASGCFISSTATSATAAATATATAATTSTTTATPGGASSNGRVVGTVFTPSQSSTTATCPSTSLSQSACQSNVHSKTSSHLSVSPSQSQIQSQSQSQSQHQPQSQHQSLSQPQSQSQSHSQSQPLSQPQSQSQCQSQPQPQSPSPPSSMTAGLEEYWERNNPIRDVDDIAVPVLCINSLDDPFHSASAIPYDLFRCYPNFLLVVTEKGGHCGFLERYPFRSWADCLCLDYLEAVFELTTRGYATSGSASSSSASSHPMTSSSSVSASSSAHSRRNTRSTI